MREQRLMYQMILLIFFVSACLGVATAQADDPCPPGPKDLKDINTGAKKHLACEWRRPDAIPHLLKAMELYTEGETHWEEAVAEVKKGATDGDWNFYEPAQGVQDAHGKPSNLGRGAFLEMLATANVLDDPKVWDRTSDLIGEIFKTDIGKKALVNIDHRFRQEQRYYSGLYLLLKAVSDKDQPRYSNDLEVLRAAYEKDRDWLVSLVAAKIFPAK